MKNKNFMKYAFVVLGLALGVCASAHGMAFNPATPLPRSIPAWRLEPSRCLLVRSL